jgi:hypothetical protein
MQQKSLSLVHFQKKFGKEKACQKHLFRLRWGVRRPATKIAGPVWAHSHANMKLFKKSQIFKKFLDFPNLTGS